MARLSESAKKIVGIWMHCLQFTRNTQDSSRLANDTLDSTWVHYSQSTGQDSSRLTNNTLDSDGDIFGDNLPLVPSRFKTWAVSLSTL